MEKRPIVSKFFWLIVGLSLLTWFFTKSFMAGVLPVILYVFIRVCVNLMLVFDDAAKRI